MRAFLAASLLCLFALTPASAGFQHPWDSPSYFAPQKVKAVQIRRHNVAKARVVWRRVVKQKAVKTHPFALPIKAVEAVVDGARRLAGVTSSALPSQLQNILHQVAAACAGFRVTSACRPGATVAGTNRTSLHASCRAADFQVGNYACAYAVLRGFPGGVSMDAHRVAHIHVSYAPGSGEWGARFNHGTTQYARRGKHRYARRNGRRT
jgi:hypothetical protein